MAYIVIPIVQNNNSVLVMTYYLSTLYREYELQCEHGL